MKGLELAEKYYRTYGESMIREQFPEWEGRIAVGLTGSGSECYGYDLPSHSGFSSRTSLRVLPA